MNLMTMLGIADAANRSLNSKKHAAGLLLACAATACMAQGAQAATASPAKDIGAIPANGQVVFEGTGFNVMNVQLVRGSSLQFANPGDAAVDLRIVTWRGKVVKDLKVPARGHAAWTPTRNGVYDYFDAKSTNFGSVPIDGADGEKVYQPVGHKIGSKAFSAPAYGIVAVTDANGGGIPLSSSYGPMEVPDTSTLTGKHHRAFMNHANWMEVPGGTMTFKPWVLTVKAGQAIQVYNEDGMTHGFFPGTYPVMYDDHGHITSYRSDFQGFVLHKNGGHRSITFDRPGIYHILCPIHSYAWEHTYKSHRFYGGYPYVMDAVVVVVPNEKA